MSSRRRSPSPTRTTTRTPEVSGFAAAKLSDGSTFKIAAELGFDGLLVNFASQERYMFVPTDAVIRGFLQHLGITMADFKQSVGFESFIHSLQIQIIEDEEDVDMPRGFPFRDGTMLLRFLAEEPDLQIVQINKPGMRFAVHFIGEPNVPIYDETIPLLSSDQAFAIRGIYSTPELNESYKRKRH